MSTKTDVGIAVTIHIPPAEAADLAVHASKIGVPVDQFISYHALRSAYGVNHPLVSAFDFREPGRNRDK